MSARFIRRGLVIAGGTALLFVAVMGFAHTPAGRPVLGAMGRAFRGGACPLGYDRKATPAERERARARFTAQYRGERVAAGRPALGFSLDHTSRQDVVSFMKARGVQCLAATSAADLVCENVNALPAADASGDALPRTLWLNFGMEAQLISVIAFSRAPRAETITAAFADVTGVLERGAGPATRTVGERDAQSLSAGALRQTSAEFRFADYYASARATNTGQDFLLTEEYRSLAN